MTTKKRWTLTLANMQRSLNGAVAQTRFSKLALGLCSLLCFEHEAELFAQDLAAGRHRELRHDAHTATQPFGMTRTLTNVLLNVIFCALRFGARFQLDVSAWDLCFLSRVIDTNDTSTGNLWVGKQQRFELSRRDLVALILDQLFDAIHNTEVCEIRRGARRSHQYDESYGYKTLREQCRVRTAIVRDGRHIARL